MMSFLTRFRRSRRSATAVTLAIMFVPLVIAASAGVDIARAVSARTQLQAAADAAAIAGAGAWQTSESSSVAQNTTTVAFDGTGANLSNFISGATPTVDLTCTGSTTQCGASAPFATSNSTYSCPAASEYCVVVTASGTLHNSLFAWLIPSDLLSVRSVASASFPPQTISGKNIPPSPGFGSAGDVSGIYAYAVPMTGGTPDYNQMPAPNAACNKYSSIGPLALLSSSSAPGNTCNYLFIALSTSSGTAGNGGSITLQQNQPISFRFVNYTGANGYHSSSYYQSDTQIYESTTSGVTGTYYPNGFQAPIYTTQNYTCSASNSSTTCPTNGNPNYTTTSSTGTVGTSTQCQQSYNNYNGDYYNGDNYNGGHNGGSYTCTTSVVTYSLSSPLAGRCPDSTLYGSLDPLGSINSNGVSSAGVPDVDSLNSYSSAYEVLGYPPTYEANHALVPFIATTLQTTNTVAGKKYYITSICPNYETSGTDVAGNTYDTAISAPISAAYSSDTGWQNLNIFSTAFPGQNYSDNSLSPAVDATGRYATGSVQMTAGTGDVYPPAITACTPATNTSDGGTTTTPGNWWDWHGSNTGNCANESSAEQSAYVSTPGQAQYSNCALVIQDLGNSVPTNGNNQALLPDYYLVVKDPSGNVVGLDPIWDGQSFKDVMGDVITNTLGGLDPNITVTGSTVSDADTAATYNTSGKIATYGYTPTSNGSYTLSTGTYAGDTVYVETPAQRGGGVYDFDLPPDTSHTCYNPQDNGNAANTVAIQNGSSTPTTFTTTSDQNNGSPIDTVANPQLGAILCSAAHPHTYALYWNDLGTYESDDVGYWNAIIAFTCSTPSSTAAGGGPVTLSG